MKSRFNTAILLFSNPLDSCTSKPVASPLILLMPRLRHDFARVVLVAIRSRREDALGYGHNGEQHE